MRYMWRTTALKDDPFWNTGICQEVLIYFVEIEEIFILEFVAIRVSSVLLLLKFESY